MSTPKLESLVSIDKAELSFPKVSIPNGPRQLGATIENLIDQPQQRAQILDGCLGKFRSAMRFIEMNGDALPVTMRRGENGGFMIEVKPLNHSPVVRYCIDQGGALLKAGSLISGVTDEAQQTVNTILTAVREQYKPIIKPSAGASSA